MQRSVTRKSHVAQGMRDSKKNRAWLVFRFSIIRGKGYRRFYKWTPITAKTDGRNGAGKKAKEAAVRLIGRHPFSEGIAPRRMRNGGWKRVDRTPAEGKRVQEKRVYIRRFARKKNLRKWKWILIKVDKNGFPSFFFLLLKKIVRSRRSWEFLIRRIFTRQWEKLISLLNFIIGLNRIRNGCFWGGENVAFFFTFNYELSIKNNFLCEYWGWNVISSLNFIFRLGKRDSII